MAKPKRRKATLHSAGKVTEQDLLALARELYDDPTPAIPICEGNCGLFSPVKAARKAIPRIHAARDDPKKLARYARSGNDYARAFAATLMLANEGKIPFVADLRLPGETVPYVMRGRAKPFYLAGIQHHDDRALRLLAVAKWTRKRGLHFYSADRGIVCTGKVPRPPTDFLAEEAELLGLKPEGPHAYSCGHAGEGVTLWWLGITPEVSFARCLSCTKDGSTMAEVRKHVAAPKGERQFRVEPRLAALGGAGGAVASTVEPGVMKAYVSGTLSDAKLLEAARHARIASIKGAGAQYVAGDVHYGPDVDAFLRALGASGEEETALRAGLAKHGGAIVLDRPTLARLVGELWAEHGPAMLEAVTDRASAEALYKKEVNADQALEILRKAARQGAGRAALASLPVYGALPPAASAADAIARAFRGQGREAAVRVAQERANIPKAKGVALGMLTALQARQGQEWRFSASDQDVAVTLASHCEALLRGPPESYHEALAAASRGAGETAPIERR